MAKRTRKGSRRMSKRMSRRKAMRGGWRPLSPASVNDNSMEAPTKMSGMQGQEYNTIHAAQHGGMAPAFESQTLPAGMVEAARVGGTLNAFKAISGMQDGGRRRRRARKQRGGQSSEMPEEDENNNDEESAAMEGGRRRRKSRKSRKGRKGRKGRKSRKQGGGAHMNPADASAPGMLLSGRQAASAESAMNHEWALARNPQAFVPNSLRTLF